MGSVNKTKVLGLNQWEGNEYFQRTDMNDSFASIEEAVATFDFLSDKYGYSFKKTVTEENKIYNFTIKEGCPVTATKKVTRSIVDGVKQFRTEINIDGTIIIFVEKKTEDGWEGSVE